MLINIELCYFFDIISVLILFFFPDDLHDAVETKKKKNQLLS